ncbi:hypothetical protein ACRQ5D_07990 [Mucilaginibacter sp. P25]|uniref:hypothetical protein n=1 Tax=Mucilaginibacter sp. P25 TaxID=3423945 RepID=UPI003D7A025B
MITFYFIKPGFKKSGLTRRFSLTFALKAICLLLLFITVDNLTAAANTRTATPADTLADSALMKKRLINRAFDYIYEQNLRVSEGGNDYFNKIKTQLTADLAPNFVLFSTPKSRFFLCLPHG